MEVINQYSLLLRWPGSDATAAPILFTAHMDVVPVEPGTEQDWQHPPFAGAVADGRVYGRGTHWMTNRVCWVSWKRLSSCWQKVLHRGATIVLAFGHDEEISGKQGALKIAERMRELGLHFDWMVDEGGMLLADNPIVARQSHGNDQYRRKRLSHAHAGGDRRGRTLFQSACKISTIGRLSNALARIEANPFPPRLVTPVVAMLETLAPHVGQPERFVFGNLWLTGVSSSGQNGR